MRPGAAQLGRVKKRCAVFIEQETLLGAEELDGDNQYLCDTCGCKRNATRQMRLRSLPPFLCLSLQRFVFNMKVGSFC